MSPPRLRRPSVPRQASELGPPTVSENIAVVLILLFPCMGTFFAPETYFAAQDFSLQTARQPVETGFLFGRLAFFVLLIWLVYQYMRSPRVMIKALLRSVIPIVFVLWMIVSSLWTIDPSASFNRSLRILILVFFAVYLIERYNIDDLLKIFTKTGAIAIIASVGAVIALPVYAYSGLNGYEGAWRGATMHKNSLGALMTMLFIFGYYSILTLKTGRNLSIFVLFGSLMLTIMSQSATSIFVILFICSLIFVFGILTAFKTQSEKLFLVVIFTIVIGASYSADIKIDQFIFFLGRDLTFTGRTEIWESVGAVIVERPILGYGYAFWGIDGLSRDGIWADLGWAAPSAHNTFMDIHLQLGLVGVAIAVCFFAILLWRSAQLFMQNVSSATLIWPLIVLTTLFRGLSETYLVDLGGTGLFWCTLAFAALAKLRSADSLRSSIIRLKMTSPGRLTI